MRSMTGYGEAVGRGERRVLTVGLKAVNHRFLDVQVRLSDDLRGSEAALREVLSRQLVRGRIEARVEVRATGERTGAVEIDLGLVQAVQSAVADLVRQGLVSEGLSAGDLLRLPSAMRVESAAAGWDEEDEQLLLDTAAAAVAQLVASREADGAGLAAALGERLAGIGAAVERLDALRGPALAESAAALSRRVAELAAGHDVDPARLAQEVAILADRGDVAEEIDRLRAHLVHFQAVAAEAAANGKRLDFLTQEIFRELNTLGAKCRNAEMIRSVLDAKVLCEQLREQVQNVE